MITPIFKNHNKQNSNISDDRTEMPYLWHISQMKDYCVEYICQLKRQKKSKRKISKDISGQYLGKEILIIKFLKTSTHTNEWV